MRRAILILAALAVTMPVLSAQQPLAITRVLLYKNGMAYIVRTGQLAAPLNLTFHPEDMNDVLKSFSAWNPDTGALYSVGYTAGIPSSHMLSRFPFDISNPDTGLGGFLVQVKGAEIRLDTDGRSIEGTLVAAQRTERVTAPQTTSSDYRLTVMLRGGSLQSVWLSDVRSVELPDPQLREQLRSYLQVLAAGRQDVTREISVYPIPTPGPIQVAYLQQFPLWKTSYRIDLGRTEGRIQGWAQIDNPTGEAWENVTVSLLSGAPVSFQMNLYDPLYTNRTTVPVPGGQVAAPRQYQAAVRTEGQQEQLAVAQQSQGQARSLLEADARVAGGAAGGGGGGGRGGRGGGAAPASPGAPPPPALAMSASAFQQADSLRVEDFYEYTFPFAVRIASRQSALLPFLQKTMPVERLSIYNARTDRGNPRLGARVENSTDIPFEPGPVTFFHDARYAGEAVLDYLPRGEKVLVSFGVDHDIQIANRARELGPETMVRLTIAKGVAVLFMETVVTTEYEIRNKGTDARTLVIEHPRFGNRTLKDVKPFETTEGFHRFRVGLASGQQTTLAVPEVVARQTNIALAQLTRPQLALFAGRQTPREVREKLGQIVELQEQIAAMQANVGSTQATIDALFKDQERLRENLKALGTGAEDQQLRSRYLGQLQRQEDQMDTSLAQIASVNKEIAAAEARLADAISTLTFGE